MRTEKVKRDAEGQSVSKGKKVGGNERREDAKDLFL